MIFRVYILSIINLSITIAINSIIATIPFNNIVSAQADNIIIPMLFYLG